MNKPIEFGKTVVVLWNGSRGILLSEPVPGTYYVKLDTRAVKVYHDEIQWDLSGGDNCTR